MPAPPRSRRLGALLAAALPLSSLCLALAAPPAAQEGGAPAATVAVELAGQTWILAAPRPIDPDLPAELAGAEGLDCARCHPAQAAEWKTTLHALAWQDPRYRKALKGLRRPQKCHGCHAPEPLHVRGLEKRPAPRAEGRELGIDCLACHGGPGGVMLGPRGAPSEAHPSRVDPSFTAEGESRLCIACHATNIGPVIGVARDFETSGQAAKGLSCAGCHMAPVSRPAAVDPDTGAPGPEREGRSHALQTPRDPSFLAQAFRLTPERREGSVALRVANRCGHRLPGLEDRSFELEVRVLDADGGVAGEARATIDKRAYLPADGEVVIETGVDGARVRVVGRHAWAALDRPAVFLEVELELP